MDAKRYVDILIEGWEREAASLCGQALYSSGVAFANHLTGAVQALGTLGLLDGEQTACALGSMHEAFRRTGVADLALSAD